MSQREIGFGVLGLGMGAYHAQAISETKGAKLVAVCDWDEDRLNPVAEKFGVKGYPNYADMLADPEVEVVSIATESGTHADRAMEAAAAGKHLLVEKPVDVKVDKIDALIAAVKKAKVKAAAVFQSRTLPLNRRIKEAIDGGTLGKLIGVHATVPWYREQSYYEGPHGKWKGTWALDGGGSLANQGVHTVDLMQWFGGRVKSVCGAFGVFAHNIEAEDATVGLLKFVNGALGTIYTTTCAYPGLPSVVTLFGDRGSIVKEDDVLRLWKILGDDSEEAEMMALYGPREKSGPTVASDPMALGVYGHHGHIEDLVRCILDDGEPSVTLQSAKHAVEIVNAIFEAGRTGKEVPL